MSNVKKVSVVFAVLLVVSMLMCCFGGCGTGSKPGDPTSSTNSSDIADNTASNDNTSSGDNSNEGNSDVDGPDEGNPDEDNSYGNNNDRDDSGENGDDRNDLEEEDFDWEEYADDYDWNGAGKDSGNGTDSDAKKINLASNGTSAYVIVHGNNATATEITAAKELQNYLKQISGAEIPIVTDSTQSAQKEFIVGKTNREGANDFNRAELGDDGFVIKTTGSKVWLIGGSERGTLYSVYSFLEDYLGCRFFAEGIEKVPATKNLSVDEIKEDKQIPTFFLRDIDWKDYSATGISVKRKLNVPIWGRNLPGEVGGGIKYCYGAGGHTFFAFVHPDVYFSTHPEYFSMDENGERVDDKQLCLTNPEVLQLTIAGVKQWLASDPGSKIIAVSQMDTQGPCLCDECKKVYREEGGAYSGTIIRFVNAIADAIKEDYPDVYVTTYAYQYSRSAPTKTKARDNVLVELCTIEEDFRHPIKDSKTKSRNVSYLNGSSNTFAEDLAAWTKMADNLLIYDYSTAFGHYAMTFPNFTAQRENIEWYAKNGVKAILSEGNHASHSVEFAELRAYLLSKLMWDPYISEAEYNDYMNEFLQYVYGPGGKYVRKYIDLAEELSADAFVGLDAGPYETYELEIFDKHDDDEFPSDFTVQKIKNYNNYDWSKYWNWYTDVKESKITKYGAALFEKALKLAKTDAQRAQIKRASLQIDYLTSYYRYSRIEEAYGDLSRLIKNYIKANSGEFTEEERSSLPNAIAALGEKQVFKAYKVFNRVLYEKLVSEGVSNIGGGTTLDNFPALDFSNSPRMWLK